MSHQMQYIAEKEIKETNVPRIGVIGVGSMGAALVKGLVSSGKARPDEIIVFDTDADKMEGLHTDLGVITANDEQEVARQAQEVLIIAVKPQIIGAVLELVSSEMTDKLLAISIAAGISTDFLVSKLGEDKRIIRAMPNAAAMVGQSATALCRAGKAGQDDAARAIDLFGAFGVAVEVDEKMMNAVTALSGSGPAYLFVIMEALTDGAVLMGMDRPTARKLAVQTVLGAATMAADEVRSFSELKDTITSPGGTTIFGLKALEARGVRGALMEAVADATERGEHLAGK